MKQKRVVWHFLFWIVQYGIGLYNELYLSKSFSLDPSLEMFLQSATAIFILLIIKAALVYWTLYSLIPRWIKNPRKAGLYFEAVLLVFLVTLIIRLFIQRVIWPYIYMETVLPLTNLQLAARYFYSMLDVLQVVGISSAIKLFKLRIASVKNEKILVQEKLRSEILHLKAQVNPHFLFNTINSIYSLSRSQSELAPDAIMRLSKILRYILYETSDKTVLLLNELKIINDFIELQQLRFSKRLKVEMIAREIDGAAKITPLLLLPLVENAFKHGSHEGGILTVFIELKNPVLIFEISNPVRENHNLDTLDKEEGIGLGNIKRQLELLYKDYSFETLVKENTFIVKLKINLATYADLELFNSRR